MKKTEVMNQLIDEYEKLLTVKQQDILNMYYKEDFSISEIAENLNITRSAVGDSLKKTQKILEDYESKLNLVDKFNKRQVIYDKMKKIDNEIIDLVLKLEDID